MKTEMKPDLNLLAEFPPHDLEEWKQAVIDTLKGADYDKTMLTKTHEGITLKPIYTREDVQNLPWVLSMPGQAPYLRGSDAAGYTQTPWIVAQSQDEPSLEALNGIIIDELNRGLNCVQLQMHFSTLMARLPDKTDLCCRGVSLNHLEDIKTVLKGVDLKAVPVMILGNKSMVLMQSLMAAYCQDTGFELADLHGAIASDPFMDEKPDFDVLARMTLWASKNAPKLKTILLSGSIYELQGASAVQELAYILASAHQIIDELTKRGLSLQQILPHFIFKLSLGSNLFMEIAKVRAARILWAELVKSWAGDEEQQKIWIHGSTASFNKSSYDIWVNMLRSTTEGFAGVIGGVDSLQIEPFDNTLRPANEFSRRIARNQQLVLAEEAQLTKIIDPAGGCWYIEALASQLCDKAWQRLQEIDEAGGMLASLDNGSIANELDTIAKAKISAVHSRRDLKVGVNTFANPKDELLQAPQADASWLDVAMKRYAQVKMNPDADLEAILKKLGAESDNHEIMALLIQAWQKNADINQLAKALRLEVKLREVKASRALALFEELRKKVEASDVDKRIQLINMGSLAQFKARNDFSSGFFQTAGFEILDTAGFTEVDAAIAQAAQDAAPAVCICSTDDLYTEYVPALCKGLKALPKPPVVILAGYPADRVEEYKAAGIDVFIHLRANNYDTNLEIAGRLGVK